MASKVNVKFVVILGAVLVAGVCVMGVLVWKFVLKSGADHAAAAERLASEGNYQAAELSWRRAVNDEQYNREWLTGWRVALENIVPETQSDFEGRFNGAYVRDHAQHGALLAGRVGGSDRVLADA